MKHSLLSLFSCFSVVFLSCQSLSAMQPSAFDPSDDWGFERHVFARSKASDALQELDDLKKADVQIDDITNAAENKTVTFLLGGLGSAKTTVARLMEAKSEGKSVYAHWDKNKKRWFFRKEGETLEHVRNLHSAGEYVRNTEFPELRGSVLDLPGFENIGSDLEKKSAQIVRDSYQLQQLLKKVTKFRLVLLVPKDDLVGSGRGEKLLLFLQRLTEVFPDNIDDIKGRLSLIISYSGDEITNPDDFREEVHKFISDRIKDKSITKEQVELARYIASSSSSISVFPKPTKNENGQPISLDFLNNHLPGKEVTPYKGKPRIAVSVSAHGYLRKMADNILNTFPQFFLLMRQNLSYRFFPFVQNSDHSASRLREELTCSADHLFSDDPDKVAGELTKLAPKAAKDFQFFRKLFDRWTELTPFKVQLNLKKDGALREFSDCVKSLGEEPRWMEPEETIFGSYVLGASDIVKAKQKNPFVACRSCIGIVDGNVHFPGQNFLWKTSILKATKKIFPLPDATQAKWIVDLNGSDARQYQSAKAAEDQDGLPGLSGQSGGNFYGFFDMGYNLGELTIRSNGGKGSKGQDGGDGAKGADGLDQTQNSQQTNGEKGHNAGRGGKGGYGGLAGSVRMSMKGNLTAFPWAEILSQGQSGENGVPGTSGTGGKNGKQLTTSGNLRSGILRVLAVPTSATGAFFGGLLTLQNPIRTAKDGVKKTNEWVDETCGVEKKLKGEDTFAEGGSVPKELNVAGIINPLTVQPLEQSIFDQALRGLPYWKWSNVVASRGGKQ